MDAMKTHGAFSWCELMTPNPKGAANFYHQLFDWTLVPMPMPHMADGIYQVIKVGNEPVGGIMQLPAGADAPPPHWGCYITVDNVDEVVGECLALGGQRVFGPHEVPDVGRLAVLRDPQGAFFNVMEYDEREGGQGA